MIVVIITQNIIMAITKIKKITVQTTCYYLCGLFDMLTLELFTPKDDSRPVYLTGSFNDWATKDDRFRMAQVREELGADGFPTANRKLNWTAGKVFDIVPAWKTHDGPYNPQFYPDIRIVAKEFPIPQLRRKRRIAVLLPWNYENTTQRYPVLYLQDGQNLFEQDAPFGTWGVDKQLASLAQQNKGDFIVVAIDHGGKERIQEFLPYNTTKWGEGLGRNYAHFLAETLKPYIDQHFRTLPDRAHTGIGGSSMGGLISIYAGVLYPQVYSKFMIFSPSLWISEHIYREPLRFHHLSPTKIYLYAGGKESADMAPGASRFKEAIEKRGYKPGTVQFNLEIDPAGEHNESRWGIEFPKAAQWLYYGA